MADGERRAMKIYIHREGRPEAEAVSVTSNTTLRELFAQTDAEPLVLFEDGDQELDLNRTIHEAGVAERAHLFVGQRHRIGVEVLYNGETCRETFSASTRVSRILTWAVNGKAFDLSEVDAAEHTLALATNDAVPPGDVHLGSLDDATPGHVA